MPDDLSVFLSSAMHAFSRIEERHGGLNTKLSKLELVRVVVEGLHHGHQLINSSPNHPNAGQYEMLLAATKPEATQRLYKIAQLAGEREFAEFCADFGDYAANLQDPVKRKRAGEYMFILGQASVAAQGMLSAPASHPAAPDPSPYAPPPPRYQPAPPAALEPPPHPMEGLFGPYIKLGIKEGRERIKLLFSSYDKATAAQFFQQFTDYSESLRGSKVRIALALSNQMALIYHERFINGSIALPAPPSRR